MWFLYAAVIIVGLLIGITIRVQVNPAAVDPKAVAAAEMLFGLPMILLIIFTIIYGLLLLALVVMTIIIIIMRFNNNLLKGEGYLMHTLPVPTWMLILSKLIVSVIWMAIGTAASLISAALLGLSSGMLPYILREGGIESFGNLLNAIFGNASGLFIASMIVSAVALILKFYFSMAIGNLVNRNKFLLAVGAFIGIQIVLSIISVLTGTLSGSVALSTTDSVNGLVGTMATQLLIRDLVIDGICIAGFFFGTTMILKKRLNLA